MCEGGPKAADLPGGTWFANCTNSIRVGGFCHGECSPGFMGKPKIMCVSGSQGFDPATLVGRCVKAAGRQGLGRACRGVCRSALQRSAGVQEGAGIGARWCSEH